MFEIQFYNRWLAQPEIIVVEADDYDDAVYNALGSWFDVMAIRAIFTEPEPR